MESTAENIPTPEIITLYITTALLMSSNPPQSTKYPQDLS